VVTIVVPMLNERGYIDECLAGFEAQTYPSDLLDVVVVDGGSTDGSREGVDRLAAERPWLRVVENPDRRASSAFNRGVEAAKGDVVCLFSAHGVPDEQYVERSVDVLTETGAAGVGGRYLHIGKDPRSNAVGLAMVSPFGMASPHRFAHRRRDVDTISHPAYRRAAMLDIGPFDETLERNSDYEFNWRMRARGHRLVFDPTISSIYRPRPSLRALARQFWWYGRWKARVVERHRDSLRLRHVVPPGFVIALALAPLLLPSRRGRRAIATGVGAYATLVACATAVARPVEHRASVAITAACFPVMHVAWGAGFATSVVEDIIRGSQR